MRRKKEDKEEVETEIGDENISEDTGKLSRHLLRTLNSGDEKLAWNLSTDLDNPTDVKEFISTGSTLMDYIISNRRDGGIPAGKLTEISGEESSGKSLLCAHIMANIQKKGGLAVYIDSENAANPAFMKTVGVDLNKLVYVQPDCVESVFETIEKCISVARAKDVKKPVVIVWDSVAATPPRAELEGSYDPNSQIGVMARVISRGLRKLTQTVGKDKITLVFTNQLKFRPGVMYGDPMTTPGGKAIPYHASIRIRLAQSTKEKDKDGDIISILTNVTCKKTRFGPMLRKCQFSIFFDRGIEDINSWREMLHAVGEIKKAGGMMIMTDVKQQVQVGVGKDENPIYETQVVPELKFRQGSWKDRINGDPVFKAHVLDLIEKHMVVKYDEVPWDADRAELTNDAIVEQTDEQTDDE